MMSAKIRIGAEVNPREKTHHCCPQTSEMPNYIIHIYQIDIWFPHFSSSSINGNLSNFTEAKGGGVFS